MSKEKSLSVLKLKPSYSRSLSTSDWDLTADHGITKKTPTPSPGHDVSDRAKITAPRQNSKKPEKIQKATSFDQLCKEEAGTRNLMMMGDSSVGKTSLIVKFHQNKFKESYDATVGMGFAASSPSQLSSHDSTVITRTIISTSSSSPPPQSPLSTPPAAAVIPIVHSSTYTTFDNDELVQVTLGASPPPSEYFIISVHRYSRPRMVMLVGDSGVGKTCLLVKFKDDTFLSGTFISTVGIDFRNKVLTVDDTEVKLQIWDTAGQERFRSISRAYYRDAEALLLLYDVTNKQTFDNIRDWLTEIYDYAQDDVIIILVGNKADLNSQRVIRAEEGEKLAKENNVFFMETSAKSGMNVETVFTTAARMLKDRRLHPEKNSSRVDLSSKESKSWPCC